MNLFVTLLLLLVLCCFDVRSQQQKQSLLKGRLIDAEMSRPLPEATLTLLNLADSTHVTSTLSDATGFFQLHIPSPGSYRICISFLSYQSFVQVVHFSTVGITLDIGTVHMHRTGLMLREVEIIKKKAPYFLKRDTLEFNAAFFKVGENALLVDLLKKLPGVMVDIDGTIRVNGEVVKNIYVNGRPYFLGDPRQAVKNLPVEIIDRLQLYDKKIQAALQPGMLGNDRERVINITVREDKAKSMFARLNAGYGTGERYAGNGSLNFLQPNRHLSFIGGGNNIGVPGGGEAETRMNSGNMTGNTVDGLTRDLNTGFNYSADISRKLRLSAGYVFNNGYVDNAQNITRQNFMPDSMYYFRQHSSSSSHLRSHLQYLKTEYQPDSLVSIVTNIQYMNTSSGNFQQNIYESMGIGGYMMNSGVTSNSESGTVVDFRGDLLLTKRFRKQGRSIAVNVNYHRNSIRKGAYNKSFNLFMEPGGGEQRDSINQFIDTRAVIDDAVVNLVYAEPIAKRKLLEFDYSYKPEQSTQVKLNFGYNATKGQYDRINDSLSNSFKNVFASHQAGVRFSGQESLFDYRLGLYLQMSTFENHNISLQMRTRQQPVNFISFVSFNYRFPGNRPLRLFYGGGTRQPLISQLQPVPDNSNPLFILQGNPGLKAAFNHFFRIEYSAYHPSGFSSFSSGIQANITNNKIIYTIRVDSVGRQLSKPVNVEGAFDITGNMMQTFQLGKQHSRLTAGTNFSFYRDVGFVNEIKGYSDRINITQSFDWYCSYKEIFDLDITLGMRYDGMRYSIGQDLNSDAFLHFVTVNYIHKFPLGFSVGIDLGYRLITGRELSYNQSLTMLNGFLSKYVFKNRQGLIRIQGFDLLKQNVSIARSIGQNYVEDIQGLVLQRFFLVGFTYILKSAEGGK